MSQETGNGDFFAKLLAQSDDKKTPKIEVVGEEGDSADLCPDVSSETPDKLKDEEGPTLFEQMMKEHEAAKKINDESKAVERAKTSKSFGNGFKKGFFSGGGAGGAGGEKQNSLTTASAGGSSTKGKPVPTSSTTSLSTAVGDEPAPKAAGAAGAAIPTIKKSAAAHGVKQNATPSFIAEEVQRAMAEDESPMLRQLKQGEWVTPDLVQVFQNNEIISSGLRNPKCAAALQLMQQNPNEAQKRFQGDPEIDRFMREFGKVMAAHFDKLGGVGGGARGIGTGGQKGGSQPPAAAVTTILSQQQQVQVQQSKVQPIGPLHAKAIQSKKTDTGISSKSNLLTNAGNDEVEDEEAEKVRKIVSDPELSALLMDTNMQQILQECGDPIKFHRHMQNPATAAKIRKLQAAGLVAAVK